MSGRERALVLGGGGLAGIAWMYGVLAGLLEHGVDLSGADLVVGTSAGASVGANVAAGRDLEERCAAQLAPAAGEIAVTPGAGLALRVLRAVVSGPRTAQDVRARIGRLALDADTVDETERLAAIRSRLGDVDWSPTTDLRITVVDARTGEFRAFGRDDGVPLVTAVASSGAVPGVWPPVTALGTRWIDGGVRSSANADLAAGYGRVVVLAPLAAGIGAMAKPSTQVEALAATSRATLVTPDREARRAFGRNVFDPATRPPAAWAGRRQSAAVADAVRAVWEQ
ncbi:patatin-like phospholipase family protein [Pseudonocardia endophytica]|uniref:NTE family protein n=1 Tax=Pseudonocardia endophytica TaxID=401976 RepID=A0A4R1HKW8_PSEEN|nr:patatin-like phospholipase family protein [Pseudonocardia endophytica]TCK20219.1 NTE family protein [Pseudonocardia endophytica]